MTVNREWAEWQIRLCEDGIADQNDRYHKGLISKRVRDGEVSRLTGQMTMPKVLLDIENGVHIWP